MSGNLEKFLTIKLARVYLLESNHDRQKYLFNDNGKMIKFALQLESSLIELQIK